MAVETGQFDHTLEQIDAAVTDVTNAKGQSSSLSDAITAAANAAAAAAAAGKQDALSSAQLAAANSGMTSEKLGAIQEELPINNLYFTIAKLKAYNDAGTWTGDSYERYGVNFEPQSDGSVYVHGTATADAWFKLQDYGENTTDYSGFNMSGCPEGGGSTTKYCLQFATAGHTREYDTGSGHIISTHDAGNVWIVIRNGNVVDFTYYPMLSNPAYNPAEYVQGAPTNRQLYEMLLSMSANRSLSIQNSERSGGNEEEQR